MPKTIPVGIDLGTTNSVAAYIDAAGRTVVIPNTEGDVLTPSVVLFDDREVVVGKEARRANMVHPDQIAEWVKRDMGSPVYSRPIRGEYLPPEVIQACILRRLKNDVAARLGSDIKVVITVPAYFDEPRRKATADAGEMAGLSVLDIVNEPTAAAMAFGELHGYLTPGRPLEEMTVLVYDLGGGTFDVTLLRLAPGDVRALATDGDVQLGGYDWDLRLVNHLAEAFKQTFGHDPREDAAGFYRLYNGVLEAKHTLSARGRAVVQVDHAGCSRQFEVTRELFEELTADLLERTAYTTRQMLSASGLQWSDVSRLLLVGGATRMPMVTKMLTEMTGIQPDHTVNPDEAVARGAALYSAYLLAGQSEAGPGFRVTNVNAHSLGVEGIDPETYRKKNVVLIARNTQLPARFTEKFTTKSDNQRSIVIQVLEGESTIPGDCNTIGRAVIRDLPPGLPKGWPVEVTFEYGDNGRLNVHAAVSGTQSEVTLDIEREVGLSSDGIRNWRGAVDASGGFETFESLVDEALRAASPPSLAPPSNEQPAEAKQARARPLRPTTMPESPGPASYGVAGQPSRSVPHPSGAAPAAAEPTVDYQAGVTSPTPAGLGGPMAGPEASPPSEESRPRRRRVPRWLITVLGFALSSIIGLILGYIVVTRLFPNHGLPRLW
jgi:molecular chaperone DnaK